MDNDGKLLELLRNTYKNLRFRVKYRGIPVLSAADGNAAARAALEKLAEQN